MTAALYLCYQSVLEPLTQTQVVAYLEGLARGDYRMVLLTFEPRPLTPEETADWQHRLAAKGIHWHWLRYHKRPTVPATAWDVLMGVLVGLLLVRRYKVRLLHARAHVPGLMALVLKRLTGARMVFDVRGFMAEEYVDGGVWPENGFLFRTLKRVERSLVRAADALVVLTTRAKELLQQWYPEETRGKPLQVIPCCVDSRQLLESPGHNHVRPEPTRGKTIVYAGKLGGWYPSKEMVDFLAVARGTIPNVRFQVWTQSDPAPFRLLTRSRAIDDQLALGRVTPEALPRELASAHAGLSLYQRRLSAAACCPTKIAEYLAAGLPVISTAGIGDTDSLLSGRLSQETGPVGVLLRDFSEPAYQEALVQLQALWQDPDLAQRCRAVARAHFDLEQVGWVRYRELYARLLDETPTGKAAPAATGNSLGTF